MASEEAKHLNKLFYSVGRNNTDLELTLLATRDKLKPFLDEGVVHKDRKREVKGLENHGQKPKKGS